VHTSCEKGFKILINNNHLYFSSLNLPSKTNPMKFCRLALMAVLIVTFSCHPAKQIQSVDAFHYSQVKRIVGRESAVVCANALASEVGVSILKQGGNAFDAAIATQLALAVVYPAAGNIGGGGFMVAHRANGEQLALDYREMAPGSATRDMYLDKNGNVLVDKSVNGHLSGGVPGTIAGLFETAKYGKLPFKKLIQPAIDLAEKGFAISRQDAASFNNIQEDLKKFNTSLPVFYRHWKEGDTLVQTDLANTLKRIRDHGAAGFYEGETASFIVNEMKKGNGIITAADLKNYKAKWRTPHRFQYKGYTIVGMPLPSSGGILLHQMLKMVEDKPLPSYGFLSPAGVQLMTEVERRAFADRALYMGDADFYKVPEQVLTSSYYLEKRMRDYQPGIAGDSKKTGAGKIAMQKESEETTHLCVIDKEGNAVAVTTTLNNSFGSKTVVSGAGFFLNDEMDDFSAKPGVPNIYGAVGGDANAIAPGKRMLSSMSPTIVLQNGKPFLVLGTPGGTTIPTSVFQTIVDVIDFKMTAADAVNKPKFHHQWLPDQVDVERSFPAETQKALEAMGYKIVQRSSIGRTELIQILPDGTIEAVADSRGDDSASGY
jgi:gamma-glutamyltranspeptidase / glutathione hydrolase